MRLTLATLALLLTPPGTPSGGFHWQRTITPPASAPLAQACVVLDAATFANAAPALRDLRLFQDGAELPYAIEESYDPRALDSGTTPADDRSLYEPVLLVPLKPAYDTTGMGIGRPHDTRTGQPFKPGEVDPWTGTWGIADLPAHIPVERLRPEPTPLHPANLTVVATEQSPGEGPAPHESIHGTVQPNQPVFPLTIGANLQHSAQLSVGIDHSEQAFSRVIFEMRRRSLCYQPRTSSPLTLYLGGGPGIAAKTYSYASSFSTALDRPYATLGPLVPNPEDAEHHAPADPRRKHLLWAAVLAAAFFLFSATRMLRVKPNTQTNR